MNIWLEGLQMEEILKNDKKIVTSKVEIVNLEPKINYVVIINKTSNKNEK